MQEELLMQKKLEIQHLEKATGEKAPDFDSDLVVQKEQEIYRCIKGDYIDELLAQYINEARLKLPIVRLTEGWYLFGTKKIHAKA